MRDKLIMMRGLPGSGKSTTAEKLKEIHLPVYRRVDIFSTDDFWGKPYNFVPAKIREAHLWNQNRALMAMIEQQAACYRGVGVLPGYSLDTPACIIIDNTNVGAYELRPYIKPAYMLGYEIEIMEPQTPWAFDVEECAKRNTHGVPLASILGMLNRWDKDVTVEQCLVAKAPWEKSAA